MLESAQPGSSSQNQIISAGQASTSAVQLPSPAAALAAPTIQPPELEAHDDKTDFLPSPTTDIPSPPPPVIQHLNPDIIMGDDTKPKSEHIGSPST